MTGRLLGTAKPCVRRAEQVRAFAPRVPPRARCNIDLYDSLWMPDGPMRVACFRISRWSGRDRPKCLIGIPLELPQIG